MGCRVRHELLITQELDTAVVHLHPRLVPLISEIWYGCHVAQTRPRVDWTPACVFHIRSMPVVVDVCMQSQSTTAHLGPHVASNTLRFFRSVFTVVGTHREVEALPHRQAVGDEDRHTGSCRGSPSWPHRHLRRQQGTLGIRRLGGVLRLQPYRGDGVRY